MLQRFPQPLVAGNNRVTRSPTPGKAPGKGCSGDDLGEFLYLALSIAPEYPGISLRGQSGPSP